LLGVVCVCEYAWKPATCQATTNKATLRLYGRDLLTLAWRERERGTLHAHICQPHAHFSSEKKLHCYLFCCLFKHRVQTFRSKISVTNITFQCWHFRHTRPYYCSCLETYVVNRFVTYLAMWHRVLKSFIENISLLRTCVVRSLC
jgi:hypothetical protein